MTPDIIETVLTPESVETITRLLHLSVVFALIPPVWGLIVLLFPPLKRRTGGAEGRLIFLSGFLLVSVALLRYAVGYFEVATKNSDLTALEEVFNSIAHALQTFSMDEDYTYYVARGKEMVEAIGGTWLFSAKSYGVWASVINFVAPIVGGALIFEILASIFPRLRYAACLIAFWCPKYYFSRLSPRSLALAESILKTEKKWYRPPIAIFSDVYRDADSETSTELVDEAKRLGAICISTDISHVRKSTLGHREFFLIDERDVENLKDFSYLFSRDSIKYTKRASVYLFSENEVYQQIERQVRAASGLDGKSGKLPFKKEYMPTVTPVRGYRNLACNLFVDLPLYEPVVGTDLPIRLVIVGSGSIGVEVFLAAYWMGQGTGRALDITVVSVEEERDFLHKLDRINPEILKTVKRKDIAPDESLLRWGDGDGEKNGEYLSFSYVQSDVYSSELFSDSSPVSHGNYFVVATGTDEGNISASEYIRARLGAYKLGAGDTSSNTVIACVVFDDALCRTMNARCLSHSFTAERGDVYSYAFGSLKELYSCENVFLSKHKYLANESGEIYLGLQQKKDFRRENARRAENIERNYSYWADMARAMHLKYKTFSLGWITTSVFDSDDTSAHKRAVEEACARYKRVSVGATRESDSDYIKPFKNALHTLAWGEHRRWNAFTRTMGYASTDAWRDYVDFTGNHKHMDLKLHACLVECDKLGIRAMLDDVGRVKEDSEFCYEKYTSLDKLDRLSQALHEKGKLSYDFKRYDYPAYEFDSYVKTSEVREAYGLSGGALRLMCRLGRLSGAFSLDSGEWAIPDRVLRDMKGKGPFVYLTKR